MVLLDSGATHGLGPAASQEEWDSAEATQVMLADGVTESLRLKPGTKVLLSDPRQAAANASWIVPMGCLNEPHYKLEWKDGQCNLFPKSSEKIELGLRGGCPYLSHEIGAKILEQMEVHQIQIELKKLTLKAIMQKGIIAFENKLTMEMAMMVKVREVIASMPDDLDMKLVPDLGVLRDPYMGIQLPWNRRKRKRLIAAKTIVIHMFSGAVTQYWERRLANDRTEVMCVDLNATASANVLDDGTFAYLLSLCASGRVKALIGGPPCRTVSALRFQQFMDHLCFEQKNTPMDFHL